MARVLLKTLVSGVGLLVVLVWTAAPLRSAESPLSMSNYGQPSSVQRKPSMFESISSGFKSGLDKFKRAVTPVPMVEPADDPVLLSSEPKPSAELFVRVARLYEQTGAMPEAEAQYKRALEMEPAYLGALLGYAHLKDRLDDPQGAMKLYQQAAEAHPDKAPVYNNLALFHAQRGRLTEAVAAMRHAIRLKPKSAKYRNNIATILVETGRVREAYVQLLAVHGEAVAYYNLGYLLEKKGRDRDAALHYGVALKKEPAMVAARRGLERLSKVLAPRETRPEDKLAPAVRQLSPPPAISPHGAPYAGQAREDSHPLRGPQMLLRRDGPPEEFGVRPSPADRFPQAPQRITPPSRLPPTFYRQSDLPTAPLPSRTYRPPPPGSAPLPHPTVPSPHRALTPPCAAPFYSRKRAQLSRRAV